MFCLSRDQLYRLDHLEPGEDRVITSLLRNYGGLFVDYGFIDDVCKTDLTPEFTDENGVGRCRVGIWFKPLPDEQSHKLSKKYQLYKD